MFETAARLDRSVHSQHYRLSPSARAEVAQREEKKRAAERKREKKEPRGCLPTGTSLLVIVLLICYNQAPRVPL